MESTFNDNHKGDKMDVNDKMVKKPTGMGFEKYLLDRLTVIPGVWSYQFPSGAISLGRQTRFLRQPGDFLILHEKYRFLWEIKTTKFDTFYKLDVRDYQVEGLLAFDKRIKDNYAFVGVYFQKVDTFVLIRIYDFVIAPVTITPSDAASLGIVITDFQEFLTTGFRKELGLG